MKVHWCFNSPTYQNRHFIAPSPLIHNPRQNMVLACNEATPAHTKFYHLHYFRLRQRRAGYLVATLERLQPLPDD